MKYELVKLEGFSGRMASIYMIQFIGEENTVFEQLIEKYYFQYAKEIDEILSKIELIGNKRGARPE